MGGRGNLMLKPDARKKLLKDKGGSLDIESKLLRRMQKNCQEPKGEVLRPNERMQSLSGASPKLRGTRGENLDIKTRCMPQSGAPPHRLTPS